MSGAPGIVGAAFGALDPGREYTVRQLAEALGCSLSSSQRALLSLWRSSAAVRIQREIPGSHRKAYYYRGTQRRLL